MKTDAEVLVWLKNEDNLASRCLLVEMHPKIGGTVTDLYISDTGYTTQAGETPASREYVSRLIGGVVITEQVNVDGKSNPTSFGNVEFENVEGDIDTYLDAIWKNCKIEIYYGDVTWTRADFRLIFKGVMDKIQPNGRNRIIVPILDKLQWLNTPMIEALIGGTGPNKEKIQPGLLGEGFNMEPVLVDEATHKYRYNSIVSERLIEVRDNGVPITVTTPSAGIFQLTGTPLGQITCDAQGDNVGGYTNTIAGIVKKLAKEYGLVTQRFVDADIDLTNFAAYEAAHTDPVHLFTTDRMSVLDACQKVAASLASTVNMTRLGLMRLIQLTYPVPGGETPIDVTAADMVSESLKLVEIIPARASVLLGYARNYTVQTSMESGIPEEHLAMFGEEWARANDYDGTLAALNNIDTTPELEETQLTDDTSAEAEVARRRVVRGVQRKVFEYLGYAESFNLKLGDAVRITYPRWGLDAGATGRVVMLKSDFKKSRCTVQVMI